MGRERDEGQAAVELALVLPLVVTLFLAVAQVTLVAHDQILVVHAARAGAREAAVGGDAGAVRRAVLAGAAAGGGLTPDRTVIESSRRGGVDAWVEVRVRYRAPTDLPVIGALLPTLELEARAVLPQEDG